MTTKRMSARCLRPLHPLRATDAALGGGPVIGGGLTVFANTAFAARKAHPKGTGR